KEGWGLAVMEAAQHGVPTVGYSFGLRDSVLHNKTGLLVNDEKEFAEATQRLIRDSGLREKLGQAAKDFALGFSWDSTGARFEELLDGLGQQAADEASIDWVISTALSACSRRFHKGFLRLRRPHQCRVPPRLFGHYSARRSLLLASGDSGYRRPRRRRSAGLIRPC